jgi:hypothetical protein
LQSRSRHIPGRLWQYALASCRAEIWYPGEHCSSKTGCAAPGVTGPCQYGKCGIVDRQRRGQLMGNLLSFPLLCLQNYAAFKYLIPARVPVKINGDDIVFRSDRESAARWMDGVSSLGLTLSRGKTLVFSSVFSLNSTFFKAYPSGVGLIPVIRPACLARRPAPDSLAPAFRSYARGFKGKTKEDVQAVYLRWRGPQLRALGRSLRRDLHLKVSNP